jgi:hypothetical protein
LLSKRSRASASHESKPVDSRAPHPARCQRPLPMHNRRRQTSTSCRGLSR